MNAAENFVKRFPELENWLEFHWRFQRCFKETKCSEAETIGLMVIALFERLTSNSKDAQKVVVDVEKLVHEWEQNREKEDTTDEPQ